MSAQALTTLYAAAGLAGGARRREAVWTDGLPYLIKGVRGREGSWVVEFYDGAVAVVDRVLPVLPAAAWRSLARLPLGAWVRPLAWVPRTRWGVVVACVEATHRAPRAYVVRMDGEARDVTVDADALEPVVLVRGARQGETWQRAYALSDLDEPAAAAPS